MNQSLSSLKDLMSNKSNLRFKITSKKVESICNCNLKTCQICSRKRSSSMLLLAKVNDGSPIGKASVEVHHSQVLIKPRQGSNHLINGYFNPKLSQETKGSTSSSTWQLSNSHSRKTSVDSSPIRDITPKTIGKHNYKFLYVIGKGGFGRVWRVEAKANRQEYALKEMQKAKVIGKRSVNSVLNEKYLLEHLRHPFIVNMHQAFQDRENLYLVLDLLRGGDLRFHLGKLRRFSEEQTSNYLVNFKEFFIACIVLALQYIHQNGIIHRDLKPENLVFDKEGFLKLTDFGVARLNKDSVANDTSGTPGYMAPEVMCRMEHSYPVDFYALGVIAYECLLGKRPYNGKNRQEIREQILAKQVQLKEGTNGISNKAIDFVNKLIMRKPQQRLGTSGIDEIINHPWLKNYPWPKLLSREQRSLYIPGSIDGNFDFQNQISADSEAAEDSATLLRRQSVQSLFEGYKF